MKDLSLNKATGWLASAEPNSAYRQHYHNDIAQGIGIRSYVKEEQGKRCLGCQFDFGRGSPRDEDAFGRNDIDDALVGVEIPAQSRRSVRSPRVGIPVVILFARVGFGAKLLRMSIKIPIVTQYWKCVALIDR